MRAVVLGLVGAVLLSGAANATTCPVDGATFKAAGSAGLDGATFRVVKSSSKFTSRRNPSNGDVQTPGALYLLIKGERGTYLVTSFYEPGSVPASAGVSDDATKAPPIEWGMRDRANERKFSLASDFSVMSGPLQGYELQNLNCR